MNFEPTDGTPTRRGQAFDEHYYATGCGPNVYERTAPWLSFFAGIVEHINRSLAPRTVFDAGCALGMMVEAFWDRGVEAKGVDISEFAIANVRADMREHCSIGSLADPIPGRYDLVTCIEVLEHMPPETASQAICNIAAVTDTVLFSSSPYDFEEVTHVNVRPPIDWIRQFGQHGLWPDLLYDASFILPHTMLLRRGPEPSEAAILTYVEKLRLLHLLAEARRSLNGVESTTAQLKQEVLHAQHAFEQQISADSLLQAECSTLRASLSVAEQAAQQSHERLRQMLARLAAIEGSTTWRITGPLRSMFSRLPAPFRRIAKVSARLSWWVVTPHRMPERLRNMRRTG